MSQPFQLIDDRDAMRALRTIVALATKLPETNIIVAGDNRAVKSLPNDNSPYCTVELQEAIPYGGPSIYSELNEDGTLTNHIKQSYERPLRLNFYRTGASEVASSLLEMNYITKVVSFLVQSNIGLTKRPSVKKRPYLLNNEMKQRGIVDFTLSFQTHRTEIINPIHRVSVQINVEGVDESLDFEAGTDKQPRDTYE